MTTAEDEATLRDALHAVATTNAGTPPQDLLSIEDPDWAAFQSDDPEFYLRAAGKAIRNYCGWHIFPNRRESLTNIPTGSQGIICLPSRHVTQVEQLSIRRSADHPAQLVNPSDYVVEEGGWIQRNCGSGWASWSGYYYGNDPYYLPGSDVGFADCIFWHGHHALPDDVKTVAYELADQAMTVRAGNVKMVEAPGGFRAQTTQPFGLTLNPDQKNRLANYRIGMVG